ncbi:MAG TPA: ATP-binding protein [Mycobacteriales bacterium]|nr:ATP-binding protein [Mycobacteriales bacterium]
MPTRARLTAAYAVAVGVPAALAAALWPVGDPEEAAVACALLLAVVVAAAWGGPLAAAVAVLAGVTAYLTTLADPPAVVAAFAVAAVVTGFVVTHRPPRPDDDDAEHRLLHALDAAAADPDDPGALAAVAARVLRARAIVVGTGRPVLPLHDGGLGATAAASALRSSGAVTVPLASGGTVTVAAVGAPAHTGAALAAVAGRLATTLDRARLRDERHRAEILEASDGQRSALLAAVSHDLRTPLAGIKASASALSDPLVPEGDRPGLAATISEEADRLDRMVRNLLDLGRIESGRLVARPEPVPVEELVGSVLARLRPALTERRLELDVPPDLPPALVDPAQGEQALANLVENVLAHTPLNAGLIVRAARRGDRVVVRVADEGPGIPEHVRTRLFERFSKGGPGGSGLGLTIARAYAEASGGRLDAVPVDCGAAFDLALPVAGELP